MLQRLLLLLVAAVAVGTLLAGPPHGPFAAALTTTCAPGTITASDHYVVSGCSDLATITINALDDVTLEISDSSTPREIVVAGSGTYNRLTILVSFAAMGQLTFGASLTCNDCVILYTHVTVSGASTYLFTTTGSAGTQLTNFYMALNYVAVEQSGATASVAALNFRGDSNGATSVWTNFTLLIQQSSFVQSTATGSGIVVDAIQMLWMSLLASTIRIEDSVFTYTDSSSNANGHTQLLLAGKEADDLDVFANVSVVYRNVSETSTVGSSATGGSVYGLVLTPRLGSFVDCVFEFYDSSFVTSGNAPVARALNIYNLTTSRVALYNTVIDQASDAAGATDVRGVLIESGVLTSSNVSLHESVVRVSVHASANYQAGVGIHAQGVTMVGSHVVVNQSTVAVTSTWDTVGVLFGEVAPGHAAHWSGGSSLTIEGSTVETNHVAEVGSHYWAAAVVLQSELSDSAVVLRGSNFSARGFNNFGLPRVVMATAEARLYRSSVTLEDSTVEHGGAQDADVLELMGPFEESAVSVSRNVIGMASYSCFVIDAKTQWLASSVASEGNVVTQTASVPIGFAFVIAGNWFNASSFASRDDVVTHLPNGTGATFSSFFECIGAAMDHSSVSVGNLTFVSNDTGRTFAQLAKFFDDTGTAVFAHSSFAVADSDIRVAGGGSELTSVMVLDFNRADAFSDSSISFERSLVRLDYYGSNVAAYFYLAQGTGLVRANVSFDDSVVVLDGQHEAPAATTSWPALVNFLWMAAASRLEAGSAVALYNTTVLLAGRGSTQFVDVEASSSLRSGATVSVRGGSSVHVQSKYGNAAAFQVRGGSWVETASGFTVDGSELTVSGEHDAILLHVVDGGLMNSRSFLRATSSGVAVESRSGAASLVAAGSEASIASVKDARIALEGNRLRVASYAGGGGSVHLVRGLAQASLRNLTINGTLRGGTNYTGNGTGSASATFPTRSRTPTLGTPSSTVTVSASRPATATATRSASGGTASKTASRSPGTSSASASLSVTVTASPSTPRTASVTTSATWSPSGSSSFSFTGSEASATRSISPAPTPSNTGTGGSLSASVLFTPSHTAAAASQSRTAAVEADQGPTPTTDAAVDTPTASRAATSASRREELQSSSPTASRTAIPVNGSDVSYVPPTTTINVAVSVGSVAATVPRRGFCPTSPGASLHNPLGFGSCCGTRAAIGPAFTCLAAYRLCLDTSTVNFTLDAVTHRPTQVPPLGNSTSQHCSAVVRCAAAMVRCIRDAARQPAASDAGDCPWGASMLAAQRSAGRRYTSSLLRSDCQAEARATLASTRCAGTDNALHVEAMCDGANAANPALPATPAQAAASAAGFAVVTGDQSAPPTAGAGVDAVVVRGQNCSSCERSQAGGLCGCRAAQQRHSVTVLHASYLTAPPGDLCYTGAFEVLFCANDANATRSVSVFSETPEDIMAADGPQQAPPRGRRQEWSNETRSSANICETPNVETGECSCPTEKSRRRLALAVPGSSAGSLSLRNVSFCAPNDVTVMVLAADGSGACVQPLGENYTCECAPGSAASERQAVALEVAYLNESSSVVQAGVFVVCGAVKAPATTLTAQAAVTTGVTVGASLAGGPAAPLIQGASMVFLMDCNPGKDTNAEDEGSRSAVVPFDIPVDRPRLGGFLAMAIVTVGVTLLHVWLVGTVAGALKARQARAEANRKREAAAAAATAAGAVVVSVASPVVVVVAVKPSSSPADDEDIEADVANLNLNRSNTQQPAEVNEQQGEESNADAGFDRMMAGLDDEEQGGGGGGAGDPNNSAPAYSSHYEHASALLRFPNMSLKACLFGFQGLLFESLVLLRRDDRTAIETVVGCVGVLMCLAMLVVTQVWGTAAGREAALLQATYVEYAHVFRGVPPAIRFALFPNGFWRGTHVFVRRFGALYESFETKHVKWVASVHLIRAVLISILSAIKPDDEAACRAVYITLAVIFLFFGVLFLVTRPHRAPFDDFIAVSLNLCTGLLALSIGAGIDSIDRTALYLFIVYAALASVVVSVSLLVAELLFLRKKELKAREAEEAEADAEAAANLAAEDDSTTAAQSDEPDTIDEGRNPLVAPPRDSGDTDADAMSDANDAAATEASQAAAATAPAAADAMSPRDGDSPPAVPAVDAAGSDSDA